MTRIEIKERARAQLGYNIFGTPWMLALLVCFIAEALTVAAGSALPAFGGVLVMPIQFGVCYVFLKQARDGAPMNVGDIFSGFSMDFVQNLLIGLMSAIFIFLWSLLLVIPGIVKAYSYSMAYFIKVDNPELGWRDCLRESEALMRGSKLDLFMLDLSFIGWFIVGGLAFGIGTLWVVPYVSAAHAQFYESIRYRQQNFYYNPYNPGY